jgi:hypothetical protein
MSSMRLNAHLDMSHHRLWQEFKGAAVVGESLTGMHNAAMKCLLNNICCIHKSFWCPHKYKSRGFKSSERGDLTVGLPLPIHRL